MIKVYIPNISSGSVGGGWTFIRNLKEGLKRRVEFVDNMMDCDVYFIAGPTIVNPSEVHEADRNKKRIIFRVDNVPRKSRNKRSTPHERMVEFSKLAHVVIYQSEWAKRYCEPLCGEGEVIYNGVNKELFNPNYSERPKHKRYLFAYHGKNELKGFWIAHYMFQMYNRHYPDSEFWFIYDFGRDIDELEISNFDFWNGEKYRHLNKVDSPEEMVNIMRKCTHLICPSIADASPNIVLEARACGLNIEYPFSCNKDVSGVVELTNPNLDISLERMCEEYLSLFRLIT